MIFLEKTSDETVENCGGLCGEGFWEFFCTRLIISLNLNTKNKNLSVVLRADVRITPYSLITRRKKE